MLEYILQGGWVMVPLLFMSVLALAVIIDRQRALRMADVNTSDLRSEVKSCLSAGRIDGAIEACERMKGPIAAVLLVGLDHMRQLLARGKDPDELEQKVRKTMDDHVPHVIEALEKRLNLLTLVGSTSPLLGMTGTVTGMIAAFGAMREAGGLQGGAVAGGIAEALVTTAAGLLIAIPSVVAATILAKKVDRHVLEIEEATNEVANMISLGKVG